MCATYAIQCAQRNSCTLRNRSRSTGMGGHDRQNTQLEAKDRKEWQQFQKSVTAFRKSVKVGDDSNCGLVVEVKAPIISVQTQIGVQWLKIAQIYPAGMGCQFVNGVYQPQSMPVN